MQSYVKHWVIILYHIERCKVGTLKGERVSTADVHHSECFVSVHTDMFVVITEQSMDADRRWTVKEVAEYTGIYGSTVL